VSLRRRLLAGILVLLVAAIGVADAVTYTSLRSFLIGRLDEQTVTALDNAYRHAQANGNRMAITRPTTWLMYQVAGAATPSTTSCAADAVRVPPATGARPGHFDLFDRVSPDVFVEVLTTQRQLLLARASGTCDPRPVLPAHMPVQAAPPARTFGAGGGAYFPNELSFITGSDSRSTTYRAEAVQIPGGILVTAVSLTPDEQTLASVVHVEVLVSAAVLLAAVLLALVVTRIGLRPLHDMTETARAIAGGDLSRRVRTTDPRGEVGRLGEALNGMLTQIEAAFEQRTRSEGRLRRFLADASHELRTPLTSVRGYAELLRKGVPADETARAQAAARIEHEAARMGVLVDDLLLLARLDQRRPLERRPVDLAAVAADAVADALVGSGDHPVSVLPSDPVPVSGDPVRLRQVVDNLVGNALQHTPPGTPVTVGVTTAGGWAVLRVDDLGPGLAPEQAGQVFEPFYRGTPARAGEGAGLGLAIVAALAEAHGGRADVRSRPEGGTRFEVWLPRAVGGSPG
jgi:signal transduction histidine kinase